MAPVKRKQPYGTIIQSPDAILQAAATIAAGLLPAVGRGASDDDLRQIANVSLRLVTIIGASMRVDE